MPTRSQRRFALLAVVTSAALFSVTGAHANTYTWAGPFNAATTNLWTVPDSWAGGAIPVSSTTTQLVFPDFDSSSYTTSNNIPTSSPAAFLFNHLTLDSWSTAAASSITNLNVSAGSYYQMQTAGGSPSITQNGPGQFIVGSLSNGSGYGLVLSPSSGTTIVNGSGNGNFSLGSTTSGITGTGGITFGQTGLGITSLNSGGTASGGGLASPNNYTGPVTLNSGILQLVGNTALGAATNILTINGGQVRNSSTVTVSNPVVANSSLVFGSGNLTLSGPFIGTGGLHLLNTTATQMALNSTAAYSGATTIDNGLLRANSNNVAGFTIGSAASLTNTSAINVGYDGTLNFTAGATNSAVPNAAPIASTGGTLSITPIATTNSETLGNISVAGETNFNFSSLNASGSPTNTLNFGTFTQIDNGTLFFRGNWQGTSSATTTIGQATFAGGLPTVSDANAAPGYKPVVALAAGSFTASTTGVAPTAFVTYSAASGVNLISTTDATQVVQFSNPAGVNSQFSSLPAGDQYVNFNTSGSYTVPAGNTTLYALSTSGTSPVNLTGSGTLIVASGVILAAGPSATSTSVGGLYINGPTLNFGSQTGYIHLGCNQTFYVSGGTVLGSGGLVISGDYITAADGIASFGSGNSANSFTGGLTINGNANVSFTSDAQLGASGGPITLNAGVLNTPNGAANVTLPAARTIRLGTAGGGFYDGSSTGTLTIASTITGPGELYFAGFNVVSAGTVALTGSNTYTGGTYVGLGILQVSSDANFGAAGTPVTLGGTLQFASSGSFNRPLQIGGTVDTNGFSPTWVGPISASNSTATFINSGTFTSTAANPLWSYQISIGVLATYENYDGTGAISSASQTLTSGGTFALAGNGTLPQISNTTVYLGGTFQIDNSTVNNADRYSDLGRVSLAGGTLSFMGNAVTPSTETIGGINLLSIAGLQTSSGSNYNFSTGYVSVQPASATLTASGQVVGAKGYFSPGSSIYATSPALSLTKLGAGTLVLTGANNNFPAGLIISAGTVRAGNASVLGFGSLTDTQIGTTLVAAGGTLDLGGNSITEPVTLNGGSLTNSSATPATLTDGVKGITLNFDTPATRYGSGALPSTGYSGGTSGSGYNPADSITFTGGTGGTANLLLGLTATSFQVSNPGSYYAGNTTSLSVTISGGGGTGATAVAVIDQANAVLTGIIITNPGSGYTSIPTAVVATPVGDTAGTLVGNVNNFGVVGIQQSSAGTGYAPGSTAYTVHTSTGTGLSLNSPVVSSITLTASSSIGGAGDINVLPGITDKAGGFALIKIGADTVTLNGIGSYSGGTIISAGTLSIPNGQAMSTGDVTFTGGTLGLFAPETIANNLNAASGTSGISVSVNGSSTIAIVGNLNISNGATVNVTATGSLTHPRTVLAPASLNVTAGGTLDLTSNDLDLPNGNLSTISAAVATGYNGGSWTGTGITSSAAATNSAHLTALGAIVNTEYGLQLYGSSGSLGLFDKSNPGATDVLVKYTYYGDANLDGRVDGSDYTLIDAGYNSDKAMPGSATGWYNGDFNYDGKVDGSDYTLIDNAFNTQASQQIAGSTSQIASSTAQLAGSSTVPEPTGLGSTIFAGLVLAGRRLKRIN